MDVLWGVSLEECGGHLPKPAFEKAKVLCTWVEPEQKGKEHLEHVEAEAGQEAQRCVQIPHCDECVRVAMGRQVLGGMDRPKYECTSICLRTGWSTAPEPMKPGCVCS